MEKIMKVLVIDDQFVNRVSARKTLMGHELTLLSSFEEGAVMLTTQQGRVFDAALIDLEFPPDEGVRNFDPKQSPSPIIMGGSQPLGWNLLLIAALVAKIPRVAIVTSGHHHNSVIIAGFDASPRVVRQIFRLGDSNAAFVVAHEIWKKDINICYYCQGTGVCSMCEGTLKLQGLQHDAVSKKRGDPCWCTKEASPGKCDTCKGVGHTESSVFQGKDWLNALQVICPEA